MECLGEADDASNSEFTVAATLYYSEQHKIYVVYDAGYTEILTTANLVAVRLMHNGTMRTRTLSWCLVAESM